MVARAARRGGSALTASRAARAALSIAPIAFFALALWALRESLSEHRYADIAAAVRELPAGRFALALAVSACGYLVLCGYDLLGLRYVGRTLRLRDFALASFAANALGNSIGNILVTGAAVRYWMYSSIGITAGDVARLVAFCSVGFWLGFLALGGLWFLAAPIALPAALHVPAATTAPLGVALLAVLAGYLAVVALRRAPLEIGRGRISLPSPALTFGQLAVASLDITLMAAALYVLLPPSPGLSFAGFMGAFLLALAVSTASQVPGGLGVFESVVLALAPPAERPGALAALIAFRAIYFVLPLLAAVAWLAAREARKRGLFGRAVDGIATLLRPAGPRLALPDDAALERVRPIIERSALTYPNLAYRRDKALLVSRAGNAMLMYGRMGRSWIAMGDPAGPGDEARELVREFHDLCRRWRGRSVFFEVRPEHLGWYADLGLTLTPLGEEARVDLSTFDPHRPELSRVRQACAKLARAGCRFDILPREDVAAALPALMRISGAWLARKATREKGFSNASFDEQYLGHFPIAVVRKDGEIIAFANLWQGAGKEELSVDLMRHAPEAPNGTMDLLFSELLLRGRAQGYRWFNFGMAPLSGLDAHTGAPLWQRFGTFVYRHGEHFYNFRGLRAYKEKFHPVWTPLYLVSPGGAVLPGILLDVTAMIAGGYAGIFSRRGARRRA